MSSEKDFLGERQREDLRAVYRQLAGGKASVDVRSLANVLARMDLFQPSLDARAPLPPGAVLDTRREIERLTQEFDENRDGQLSEDEFVDLMLTKLKTVEMGQALDSAFRFVAGADDKITTKELGEAFAKLSGGADVDDQVIKDMMKLADQDVTKNLSRDEFIEIMLTLNEGVGEGR